MCKETLHHIQDKTFIAFLIILAFVLFAVDFSLFLYYY